MHAIDIHTIHEPNDGGACTYEKKFIKTGYLDGNGKESGYYFPGGHYISFVSVNGSHRMWLDNF